ncbi:signal peptidase I [Arthrobacter sp. UYEF6]
MTKPARRKLPFWASVGLNLLVSLAVVAVLQGLVAKIYRVPSGSMEQTLQGSQSGGDRILANRLAYLGEGPRPQDVAVFAKPPSWQGESPASAVGGLSAWIRTFGDITGIGPSNEQYMVKRVIAVGDQTISCCGTDGKVRVDGSPLEEPYIYRDFAFEDGSLDCSTAMPSARCFAEFTVPKGQLVVMGDHRSNSSDSVGLCRMQPASAAAGCLRTVDVTAVIGKVNGIIWPLDRISSVE